MTLPTSLLLLRTDFWDTDPLSFLRRHHPTPVPVKSVSSFSVLSLQSVNTLSEVCNDRSLIERTRKGTVIESTYPIERTIEDINWVKVHNFTGRIKDSLGQNVGKGQKKEGEQSRTELDLRTSSPPTPWPWQTVEGGRNGRIDDDTHKTGDTHSGLHSPVYNRTYPTMFRS